LERHGWQWRAGKGVRLVQRQMGRLLANHAARARLTEALAAGGDEAKRAFDAMMGMKKIDVAAIKAARRG
jgi:predicted 3-demethylubiquinone-9 3-methyltransferase (glyoxalase superfamily)